MEFCLLGSLLVRSPAGAEVHVAVGKQRVLLAALLLHANRIVPADELCEVLWEWRPPPSARAALRNYVKRLRKALGDIHHDRIRSMPGGYLIRVGDGDLDLARFEQLTRSGREAEAAADWTRAAERMRTAMSLWRGEALADVRSEWLTQRELPRLNELRLRAVETLIDLDLRLGQRTEAIAELRRLTGAHPLRERLHFLLMLALCQDGRRGEALVAYQGARSVLCAELGAEPGPELQGLHQRILAADPRLPALQPRLPGPAARLTAPAEVPVPRQLPPATRRILWRAAELAVPRHAPDAIVILTGEAGAGKTTLTLRWAHEIAGQFPDGQLYADLRGDDPDCPVTAHDALAGFLHAVGVPPGDVPATLAERTARLRSVLAGRRVLVVLDNACSAEQVRPLLPAAPGCATLITSRDPLCGLAIEYDARRLEIELPSLDDAVEMLRQLIGRRVDDDIAAARTLALRCARLPLALSLAAEFAVLRPMAPLGLLARELGGRHGLRLLDACADQRTALRTAFAWSYRRLDQESARVFRLLGLWPVMLIEAHATAVMTGMPVMAARRSLTMLARARLIRPAGPAGYRMHGLLRAYAAELAAEDRPASVSQAGLPRGL